MVRRLGVLGLVAVSLALLAPQACATELGLAGIRLDQRALDLLDLEAYGTPNFMGPLGVVTTWGITQPEAASAAAALAAAAARAPAFGAAPAAGPAAAAPRSGGFRIALGGRRAPATTQPTPAPTTTARPATLRFGLGGTRSAGATTGGLGAARPMSAAPAGEGGQIYWLYNKGMGVQVVAGISASGTVNSIVVSGQSYPAVRTEGGVRLGDTYTSVLNNYGFPDTTQNIGDALVLGFQNAGLTLTLRNMRVQTIALSKAAPAPVPAAGLGARGLPARAPTARPGAPARPGAAAGTPGTTPGQRPGGLRLRFNRRPVQ
jgi:hypothetical protein